MCLCFLTFKNTHLFSLFYLLSHRGHAGSKRHKSNHRWLLCMAVKAVKARHTTFCNGRQCGHARLPSHRKWEGGGGDTLPSYRLAFLDYLEMPICLQFNHSPLMSGTCADGFQNGLVNIIQKLAHRQDRDGNGTAASIGGKRNWGIRGFILSIRTQGSILFFHELISVHVLILTIWNCVIPVEHANFWNV